MDPEEAAKLVCEILHITDEEEIRAIREEAYRLHEMRKQFEAENKSQEEFFRAFMQEWIDKVAADLEGWK